MPEPHKGETREDFVNRCAADEESQKTFPDDKQRVAFCESRYDEHAKKAAVRAMPVAPHQLRAPLVSARPARVDRDKGIIYGYNVAELGDFKDRRGRFDGNSLREIATMMNRESRGIRSRFTHPTLSADGLGKFLGRAHNAYVQGDAVKADLHLSKTSRATPHGDLGGYVMDLAEEDSAAFGTSLVLIPAMYDKDDKGNLVKRNQDRPDYPGDEPPLWLPEVIMASDVVDEGDAVHSGFLSVPPELRTLLLNGELPDDFVRTGSQLLDSVFAGQKREVVEARVTAWLFRYLDMRHGQLPPAGPTPKLDARRERLEEMARRAKR